MEVKSSTLINLEAEKSLLNCLFLAKKEDHQEVLDEILLLDDNIFSNDLHKKIFLKFKELVAQGMTPDAITIDYFVKDVDLNLTSNNSLLNYLVEDVLQREPSAYVAPTHIKILKDLERRRSLAHELFEFNSRYIKLRDKYIAMLRDTSTAINEEEILNFLCTIK